VDNTPVQIIERHCKLEKLAFNIAEPDRAKKHPDAALKLNTARSINIAEIITRRAASMLLLHRTNGRRAQ